METTSPYENIRDELFADLSEDDKFLNQRPMLAHYTSISTLENILKNNEIWLSSPLFMNDLEEVRFGINNGIFAVRESESLQVSLETPDRNVIFMHSVDHYLRAFEESFAIDIYILSLSLHQSGDEDGILSMWRSYAANGTGAAIVFDSSKLQADDDSPMIVAPVKYAPRQERLNWLNKLCERAAAFLKNRSVPDDQLYLVAHALLERIKLFALFTKHDGFREENEWRVVYYPERDDEKKYASMMHYFNGPRGVEPKLKLRFGQSGGSPLAFELDDIIDKIILGPTASSLLTQKSVERMLNLIGHKALVNRVVASSIPLRPT